LADLISAELANTGTFAVVEKSNSIEVGSEFQIGPKDTINQATAVAIGKKTGARFLLLGNVMEYGEKAKTSLYGVTTFEGAVKFNLRAVDSATGEVVFSQTIEKRGVGLGEARTGAVMGTFGSKAMQDAVGKSLKDAISLIVKRLGSRSERPD
jgi:curli biogenesis system outer membrane secretion channel CsgG